VRLTANRKRRGFGLCILHLRHAWPDQTIFETREEAQEHATEWLWTYNNDRYNMAIGGITSAMKL